MSVYCTPNLGTHLQGLEALCQATDDIGLLLEGGLCTLRRPLHRGTGAAQGALLMMLTCRPDGGGGLGCRQHGGRRLGTPCQIEDTVLRACVSGTCRPEGFYCWILGTLLVT